MKLSVLFSLYVIHFYIYIVSGYIINAPSTVTVGRKAYFNFIVQDPEVVDGDSRYFFHITPRETNGLASQINFNNPLYSSTRDKQLNGTVPFTVNSTGMYFIQAWEKKALQGQSDTINVTTSLPSQPDPKNPTLRIVIPVLLSVIIIICCIVIFILWRRLQAAVSHVASSTIDFRRSRMLQDQYSKEFMYERDMAYGSTVIAPSITVGPSDSISQVSGSIRRFKPALPGYQGRYGGVGRDRTQSWVESEVETEMEKGEVIGLDYSHSVPVVRYIPATPSPPSTLVDSRTGARRNRF
ncbi:hypothetical protein K435DRAFT_973584 [Dendrothele bispora CBS 962.96]|uniref:Uncharacterized protein n=1 Tax=Dendrothele bispora (strain CBS 962.96) TaxID=1314807 RepID=A0A4S8KRP5_DENBC|nr:hypothetical protein K435DRAFT_973584 [Dendrothele bispora CBS 962.96]